MQKSSQLNRADSSRRGQRRPVGEWFTLVLVLPLFVALALAMGLGGGDEPVDQPGEQPAVGDATAAAAAEASGRLVVVILDSLRPQNLADDRLMPSLYEFVQRPDTIYLPQHTCKANFSLPCIQTMLEGRQSPFVAGLHNFTGQSGSQASLPGTLNRAGYDLAMISDHTLDSLYAADAKISVDVQQEWKDKEHLERDLLAIERAQQILDDGEADVLLLHTVGTDKSAHKDHPGSERYERHFGAVDEALGAFLQTFDFERDSLIIAGDHGHGELGHHDKDSVAIFAGRTYQELFEQLGPVDGIVQTDLLYFMSYPMLLPIPVSYEGTAFSVDQPRGLLARFLDVQRAHLKEAGISADLGFDEAMAQVRQKHHDERFDPLIKYVPLLLLFSLFLAHALAALKRGATVTDAKILIALVAAALPTAFITSAERGLWLALPLALAGGYLAWRRRAVRAHLFVLLAALGAGATAMHAGGWADFFHTTGGFKPAIVLFYALLFGGGALLAKLFFDGLDKLPYGAMAFAFFVLPSGLYYYQSAQNILFGLFVGALPLGLWWLYSRRGERPFWPEEFDGRAWLSAALCGVLGLLLIMQEAGGWAWHLHAVWWMEDLGQATSFAILGLMIAYWTWTARSGRRRAVVAIFGLTAALACSVFGELPAANLAGALLPAVFLAAFLDTEHRLVGAETDDGHSALAFRRGFMLAALAAISLWIATSGFLLQNVDFSFALDWFSEYFARESTVFFFTFLATLVKYGLPPAAVLAALRTVGRREDFRPVVWGMAAFLSVEVFMLLVQIFAGSTSGAEKYHELTISELLFVYPLTLTLVAVYLVVRAVERFTD